MLCSAGEIIMYLCSVDKIRCLIISVWGKEVAVSSVRELLTQRNAGIEPGVGDQMQDSESSPRSRPVGQCEEGPGAEIHREFLK